MHVLIIPSFYPTDDNSINGIFFQEQAEMLINLGNKVGVIYPELRSIKKISINNFKKNHFQIKFRNENGINVIRNHRWNIIPTKFFLGNKVWIKKNLLLFKRYVKIYGKPDIIHAHCALWAGEVSRLISKKYNIPYIITEHSTAFARNMINEKYESYIKDIYENSKKTIAVSKSLALILKKYRKDINIINNMVDCKFFEKKQKEINKKNNKEFIFFTICFLNEKKGIDILIKAFSKIFKGEKNVKLIIAGDGPLKQKLIELAENQGLKNNVEFLGLLDREEVRLGLSNADCFVLPSFVETFGVVFIEAMAMGLPVIGTICGGPEEFIVDSVGKLVEVGNIEMLSNEMEKMRKNIHKYDSDFISQYAYKNFDKEIICNKIQNIYYEVVKKEGNLYD